MPTILIAGGTGLIGQRLSQMLKDKNHTVLHLSRRSNPDAEFPAYVWDLKKGFIEEEAILRADYLVNLAGESAGERWTAARKKSIIASRVNSNLLLKNYLEKLSKATSLQSAVSSRQSSVKAYISASAIGFYGDRGETLLYENDPPGKAGFLPESVVAWENAIRQVQETGVRTVALRIGLVLSPHGGALEKMLLPFRFLVAPYFGNGRQWYSWIHLDDLCRIIIQAIENEEMTGIYNATTPHPARNKDLILAVKKALRSPALVLPAPVFALRLALGEMADTILGSTKVSPEKLLQTGFRFQFPELLPALQDLLRRKI